MLSIIICSVSPDLLKRIEDNISLTIGIPYELIVVDNRQDSKGICEVYNKAANDAKYDYLCFVHEDLVFNTSWGNAVINILNRPGIGVLGIMGASCKSTAPISWADVDRSFYVLNSDVFKDGSKIKKVAVLDGCFLACRKEVWSKYRFDEKNLRGFHIYDIDFSFRIGLHYENVVSNQLDIYHLSNGNFDKKWFIESYNYHDRLLDQLIKTKVLTSSYENVLINKQEYNNYKRAALYAYIHSPKMLMGLVSMYTKIEENFSLVIKYIIYIFFLRFKEFTKGFINDQGTVYNAFRRRRRGYYSKKSGEVWAGIRLSIRYFISR